MKVIEKGWQRYRELVLDPIGAPEVQVTESRKAFYAGASHLFATIVSGSDSMTVDEQADALDTMSHEIADFALEISAEVAKETGSSN